MKGRNKRKIRLFLTSLTAFVMLFATFPIALLFPVAAGENNPPQDNRIIHIWDHNIKSINKQYWGHEAQTDIYKVKFPGTINGSSAELTTVKDEYLLKMKIGNITCHNFIGKQENSAVFKTPKEVKAQVRNNQIIQ